MEIQLSFLSYIPMILLFAFFFIGIPLGYSLILSSLVYFTFLTDLMPIEFTIQNLVSGIQNTNLLAMPMFIFAGMIMNYSGITERLMNFSELLVGHLPGGLGQVNVVLSTLMGGVSGSGNADTAMQCKMLVPEMVKRGYDKEVAAGITATSAIIPAIIPPGILLIYYAMSARVSIGKLFMAGYIPGIVLCAALMIAVALVAKKRGYPPTRSKIASPKEICVGAGSAVLALFMPLGLLMGLRFGMFTATEGGAIAVFYCVCVGTFIYKKFKPRYLWPLAKGALMSTAQVVIIIVGAKLFGFYLTWEHIPEALSAMIIAVANNKYLFLLAVNVIFLFLGMFMEASPCIFIFVPLLLPILQTLDINLIHFGIMLTLNLMIGGISPPYGSMMFIACAMTDTPVEKFVKSNMPFLITCIIVLLMVTYIEPITMFLPGILFA